MQLKGTTSTPQGQVNDAKILSKEEQTRQELDKLVVEEKAQEQKYHDAIVEYHRAQRQVNHATDVLRQIRSRKDKLGVYVKDLDNDIQAGRWYCFDRCSGDSDFTPLVYIVEVRRPRKYTWVTMFWFSPKTTYNAPKGRVAELGTYEVSYVEANYPTFKEYLKEDTVQNRMGVLVRWGLSAEKLLEGARKLWANQKPIRIQRDPNWELNYRGENKKTLYLESAWIVDPTKSGDQ